MIVDQVDRNVSALAENRIEFWFDFASTYSYLSSCRIDRLVSSKGVEVIWRPLFLGAMFNRQGWDTSPFNIYPAKGRNMWRDLERRAAVHGVPARRPSTFPQHSLLAGRVALVGLEQGWGCAFIREVFTREFVQGEDISRAVVIADCVKHAGGDPPTSMDAAGSQTVKDRLRHETERALTAGVFGAPTMQVGDELFWGDDRLEEAVRWATGKHPLQTQDPQARRWGDRVLAEP